jgi:hypothetical protein
VESLLAGWVAMVKICTLACWCALFVVVEKFWDLHHQRCLP